MDSAVLIAGGGPAGSSTAIALRRRGVPVLLLDQATFPRDKVCGDVILPAAQDSLRLMGMDLSELNPSRMNCTGARYHGPDGRQVSGRFQGASGGDCPWWMIKRRVFDAWLLDAARRAGAEVREGCRVESVLREDGRVTGVKVRRAGGCETVNVSAVLGADGASSAVARSVGLFAKAPRHVCLAARTYVRGDLSPEPYLEVFTNSECLPGCAWIVPVGPDEYNVGVGIIQADAHRLGTTPEKMFNKMLKAAPWFAERLRGIRIPPLQGWVLPSASEGRKLAGPGFLLVGDAGAMVDPFTGHGIHHALSAGSIAGEAIANAIDRGVDIRSETLISYEQSCRAAFLREAELGYRLQRLHSCALAVRLGVRLIGVHEGLRRFFLALVGHTAPRGALVSASGIGRAVLALH